jgi:hypothetical protein
MTSAIPADNMPSPRRWIDVLILAGGALCATRGLIWAAVPLLAFGLVAPTAAWTAAMAEVDAISPRVPAALTSAPPEKDGVLVTALLVALTPGFIAWDLVCGAVRGLMGLRDGLTLRIRAVGRLVVQVIAAAGDVLVRTARAWRSVRLRIAAAGSEARHRFLASRVRLRHRLRTLRRTAH